MTRKLHFVYGYSLWENTAGFPSIQRGRRQKLGIVLATMSLVCVLINPYVVLEAATLHSSYQEAVVRVVYPDTEEELLPDLTGILYAPVNWADPSDEGYHALFYSNPLIPLAPDPDLLKAADGRYYLYPTGGSGFDVYVSDDLVH